ncbi:MAG: AAA family ATPase [Gemmatimonadota bacterium]
MNPRVRVRLFGGPIAVVDDQAIELTPYQQGFLALVYTHREVSRPAIVRSLWGEDADSRRRSSVRQLRHQVNRRAGVEVIGARGDQLFAPIWVECDLTHVETSLSGDRPSDATNPITSGFLANLPSRTSQALLDWRDDRDRAYRDRLYVAVRAAWETHKASSNWIAAVDSAMALNRIEGAQPAGYARLIEAHARAGYVREAEMAYSEYRRTCARDDSAEEMDSLMLRVRKMSRESDGTRGVDDIPFVGRREELAALLEVVASVGRGRCALGVVRGEAGIGKSRLLGEVRRMTTLDGFRCLAASPTSLERRISLSPIFDAISSLELGQHLDEIGEPWRSVVTSMMPPRWEVGERRTPPPIDETALTRRLFEAFALLLHSIAREQPTLLFLDDAHWADTTTLMLLDFYQKRWSESALGVFLAMRPELVDTDGAMDALTTSLPARSVVPLEELSPEDGKSLVVATKGGPVDEGLLDHLFEIAGLHPLYLVELIQDVADHRLGVEAQSSRARVPVSVLQILTARTGSAQAGVIRAMRIAGVWDRPMSPGFLAAIAGWDVEKAASMIDELCSRRLMRVEDGLASISHPMFRQAICEGIPPTLRAVLHGKVATHLKGQDPVIPGPLAIHLDQAGDRAGAAEYGWQAATEYAHNGATAEASHFFAVAARNETDPTKSALALAREAEAGILARDLHRSILAAEAASKQLRALGMDEEARRAEVRGLDAQRSLRSTKMPRLLSRLSIIKSDARSAEDWEALALALDAELQVLFAYDGDSRIAAVLAETRELLAVREPAAAAASRLILALGCVVGDPDEGLRSAREAVAWSRRAPKHRAVALMRLFVALHVRGRFMTPEGQRVGAMALDEARRGGNVRARHLLEVNHAVGFLDAGELEMAEHWFETAARSAPKASMGIEEMYPSYNRGELALARGDLDEARTWFEVADEALKLGSPLMFRALVSAGVGLCALETGDLAEARRREGEIPNRLPTWCHDPTILVAFRAKLASRRGYVDQADQQLSQASALLANKQELAWLKVGALHAQYLEHWGRLDQIEPILIPRKKFAERHHMDRMAAAFDERILRAR